MVRVRDHRFFSNGKGISKPHPEQDQIGVAHNVFRIVTRVGCMSRLVTFGLR